jgi:hypothetical protein
MFLARLDAPHSATLRDEAAKTIVVARTSNGITRRGPTGIHEGRDSTREALQQDHPFREGSAVSVDLGISE